MKMLIAITKAQLRKLEADAKRWRFVRDKFATNNMRDVVSLVVAMIEMGLPQHVAEAVDKAIAEQEKANDA